MNDAPQARRVERMGALEKFDPSKVQAKILGGPGQLDLCLELEAMWFMYPRAPQRGLGLQV